MFSSLPSTRLNQLLLIVVRSSQTGKHYVTVTIYLYFLLSRHAITARFNEHSNGILRRSGLDKELDFNLVTDDHIISVAQNYYCPRKSLGYRTPLEVFMSFIEDDKLVQLNLTI